MVRRAQLVPSCVGLKPAWRSIAQHLSRDLPYEPSADDVYLTSGCAQVIEIVQTLISVEGIEISAGNRAGETAFAIAEKLGNEELANILREAGGVIAKEQVNPPSSAKRPKQTVSDVRHYVQSQIKQTCQTKMHFHKIKKRIQKLHISGLNNAMGSNTVVAVLIAMVAFAAIFQLPGNFLEDISKAPDPNMTLGQAFIASGPAFIIFLIFDTLALFISLAVVVMQTSLIVVEQKAKKKK